MTSEYLYGCDVVGAEDGDLADAVTAVVHVEKPLVVSRARELISVAVGALAEMNFFDQEEETATWRDDMAQQLARMDETISQSGAATLPDKAADVLSEALSTVAGMLEEGAQIYPQIGNARNRFLQALNVDIDVGVDVLGAAVREWDNHDTYDIGDVVYYDHKYWRALRRVEPPFFPALMDGKVPGKSDRWQWQTDSVLGVFEYDAARTGISDAFVIVEPNGPDDTMSLKIEDVLGGGFYDIIGMEDIAARQKQMNNVKPVTVGIAKILLKYGQQAIHKAVEGAKQPWYRADLPGETARNNAFWKLQWHADTIAKAGADQNAMYGSADDLKKWVMQAFIEENAVEEGNVASGHSWSLAWSDYKEMMAELAVAIAALPKKITQFVATLPGKAFESLTGVPSWMFYVGAVALTGLVGYGAYKILAGPVGGAVVGHYLGGRRR